MEDFDRWMDGQILQRYYIEVYKQLKKTENYILKRRVKMNKLKGDRVSSLKLTLTSLINYLSILLSI